MKKLILNILLLSSIIFSNSITVAVLDLDGVDIKPNDALILTQKLRSQLVKTGNYTVLDRSRMSDILQEQGIQQTGITSNVSVVEVGEILGVSHIITGSVGKMGELYYIQLQIIDITTTKIIKSVDEVVSGKISDVLLTGIPNIVAKLDGNLVDSSYSVDRSKILTTTNTPISEDKNDLIKYSGNCNDTIYLVSMNYPSDIGFDVFPSSIEENNNDIKESLESAIEGLFDIDLEIIVVTEDDLKKRGDCSALVVRQYLKDFSHKKNNVFGTVYFQFFGSPSSTQKLITLKVESKADAEDSRLNEMLMNLIEELEDDLEDMIEDNSSRVRTALNTVF